MKEIIDKGNIDRFEEVSGQMAAIYKKEFAKAPWNEVTRCTNEDCDTEFSPQLEGTDCTSCGECLSPAYEVDALCARWRDMLRSESAIAEIVTAKDCLHPGYFGSTNFARGVATS